MAIVHTSIVSLLLYPSAGGEKLTLKLYTSNAYFGKFGHNYLLHISLTKRKQYNMCVAAVSWKIIALTKSTYQ